MAADGGDAPSAATSGPRSSPCSPDEGLLTLSESEGRKLASLTPAGREHVATNAGPWPDPFHAARGDDATGPDLASLNAVLHGAAAPTCAWPWLRSRSSGPDPRSPWSSPTAPHRLASLAAAAQSVGVLALPSHAQTTRRLPARS